MSEGYPYPLQLAEVVAQALMEEREKAARLAHRYAVVANCPHLAEQIAAAIRTGGEKERIAEMVKDVNDGFKRAAESQFRE